MSSDSKKVVPKKTAAQRSPDRREPAKRAGAPSKSASGRPVVQGKVPPSKTATKPLPPKPVAKPVATKKPNAEKEKKEGGGFFASLVGIFKKKTPKEELPKDSLPKTENTNVVAPEVAVASAIATETSTTIVELSVDTNDQKTVHSIQEYETTNNINAEKNNVEEISSIPVPEEVIAVSAPILEITPTQETIIPETPTPAFIHNHLEVTVPVEENLIIAENQPTGIVIEPFETVDPIIEKPAQEISIPEPIVVKTPEIAFPLEEPTKETPTLFSEKTYAPTAVKKESPIELEPLVEDELHEIPENTTTLEEETIYQTLVPLDSAFVAEEIKVENTIQPSEHTSKAEPVIEKTLVTPTQTSSLEEVTTETIPQSLYTQSYKEEPIVIETTPMIAPETYNSEFDTSEKTIVSDEETPSIKNKPKEEKKKRRGILLPFLILSLIGNGVLTWLLLREKETVTQVKIVKEQVIVERDNVIADLTKLKEDYSTLQTNNAGLKKELEAKRAEIDSMIEQANKHKNDPFIIAKLRKETETLRSIMQHYVHEIDSLGRLNQTIIAEKNKVTEDLNTQITKTTELEKDKTDLEQTVTKGSVLKALSPKVVAIRMRGGVKEVDVNKASRVEKLKISITLSENPIAKSGLKSVYVHIMAPNGKEITQSESEQNSISFSGTKGYFAEKTDVNYTNTELPVDILCASPTGFVPGKYLIDIICEGQIIGQTSILLK